ncbi:DUF5686 family protein [Ascidiimonas sp. W6]|uniref:DUF5686 family protein n=1 Tax=Ascidiimonas meishanensis TaxID=3128903 RepID=UPI0030ED9468
MCKTFIAFLLLLSTSTYAQTSIQGKVKDANTKTPIPFATILLSSNSSTITHANGSFQMVLEKPSNFFTVKYAGYNSIKIPILKNQNYYTIELKPKKENLGSNLIDNTSDFAKDLIQKTIALKKKNDPLFALRSFRYKMYNKLHITANPDSIVSAPDSIFIRKKGKWKLERIDSSNIILKKQLRKSHLYLSEKVSEVRFNKSKGFQEYVTASRMSGFEKPVNELFTLQLQSFSIYANTYTIMGNDYKAPLAKNALKTYNYKILDTVKNNSREAYIIYFSPKKKKVKKAIQGLIYLDKASLAVQKGVIEINSTIDVSAIENFRYIEEEKIWFPIEKEIKVQKGPNSDQISLFGNTINLEKRNKSMNDSISLSTNEKKVSDYAQLISKENYFDLTLNPKMNFRGKGIDIVLDDQITSRSEEFWNLYRQDSITKRDRETYVFLDSLSKSRKVENKLSLIRKLTQGYLGTKFIDFDLRYLIKYNNYEGFKPGVGAITNNNFSKKFRLSAYGLYGFKDKDFKYGLGAEVRLDRFSDTWAGFMFTDDLTETGSEGFITDGRAFYVFEPRLFNITLFHKNKTLSPFIKHDITSALTAKIQVNKSDIAPTFDYLFFNRGQLFNNYKIASLQMALHWTPANKFIVSDAGKKIFKKSYPQFTVQFTKGFQNFLDADFSFSKLNFRGIYEFSPLNGTSTSFLFRAGIAWGDLPITELYHVSPNNPDDSAILRRFAVADSNSFETMFFNEFFSDKYLSFQVRHKLKRFHISNKFKPQLVMVSRFAIGDASSQDKHLNFNFNTLEQGYYESGFEVNQLFKGFGISTFYRYGPYGLKGFDQNFSFKFTFNFSLGF